MTETETNGLLLWMDLEMTGLDPVKDEIIEIATIVTNNNLEIVGEGPTCVINKKLERLEQMDDWNRKHHSESGLWQEVLDSDQTLEQAEDETLKFIKKHFPKPNEAVLCGNSIWQDRRFIRRYMSSLDSHLHYRMVDVSSIKELVKVWYAKKMEKSKSTKHRAYDDILESIEELRHYRKHFFITQ